MGMVAGELAAREEAKRRTENGRNPRLNVVLHNVHRAEEKGTK